MVANIEKIENVFTQHYNICMKEYYNIIWKGFYFQTFIIFESYIKKISLNLITFDIFFMFSELVYYKNLNNKLNSGLTDEELNKLLWPKARTWS